MIAVQFVCSFLTATALPGDSVRLLPFAPSVVIEGTPVECGRAYGKRFREGIKEFLDREIYAAFVGKPSSKEQLLAYAAACGKLMREECPAVAEEFVGIAEGAGLTFDEIVLINLHEELYHRTKLPKTGHCTAVAIGPPDTKSDRTYVGQTWDWMESVAGRSAVVEWCRKDGVPVLAYGFPGMPFGAGMNAQGIALCWTSAGFGDKRPPRVGIPSYALIAHLLAQKDLNAVVGESMKNKHAGWFTFVMADSNGNLVNIEGSPEAVIVERSKGRLARVGYGTSEMAGPKAPVHQRCRMVHDVLRRSAGRNDLNVFQDMLAEPKHGLNVGKATIDMMVFDTNERAAYLSRGTSYGANWRKFTVNGKQQ